jgi:DNA-binding HxlR family transcriptional regulator
MDPKSPALRSPCPIAGALDLVGDRWTLVVLRDLLLANKRRFSELAQPEGIATNVLTERLRRLEGAGLVSREPDPEDGRRRIYTPTERAWELVPLMLDLAIFGFDHCGGTAHPELVEAARADRDGLIATLRGGEHGG